MTRSDPPADAVLDRLRVRPASSWSDQRITAARGAIQRLADLAADAEGEPRRTVPALHPTALADQLDVLRKDAVAAGAEQPAIDDLFAQLAVDVAIR